MIRQSKIRQINNVLILILIVLITAVVAGYQGATYKAGNVISVVDLLPVSCNDRDIVILAGNPSTMNICNGNVFTMIGGSFPSGMIVVSLSNCAVGWSEVTSLNGRFLRGTLSANNNTGVAGGNDNHSHSYNQVIAHTHSLNDIRGLGTGTMTTTYSGLSTGSDITSTPTNLLSDSAGIMNGVTGLTDGKPAYTNVIFCQKD